MTVSAAPRFSVVVPAHNEAETLPATLRSLLNQDFAGPYEIIVVDNASTDRTADVAAAAGVRVVGEPRPGVCSARQRGTEEARGQIVVSTDADTTHPTDWLSRIDRAFSAAEGSGVVAVAGPCRYTDAPWWARVVPPIWFAAVATGHDAFDVVGYLTATNVAFLREGFPGYDVTLHQGGDEMDLLRRLRSRGRIVWDRGNVVATSPRRMNQGLGHTVFVSFGYYYALPLLLRRLVGRPLISAAPSIRSPDAPAAARLRRRWRVALVAVAAAGAAWRARSARLG
jgi:glycosyltransferase involved in cell wall biosynthesis